MRPGDPKLQAFCRPGGPEVFSGIVHGSQIWTDDPFDVPSIHAEARTAFARVLDRASSDDLPATGKTMLLLGEAGSGKTHLMRAFRALTHADGFGYCGYLQMTTRADNYARYVLANLIDSLEHRYRPDADLTGLQRLARGLLDAVNTASAADRDLLLGGEPADREDIARAVYRVSNIAMLDPRFAGNDVDLLRAILYLLPNDGLLHALAVKWLRCEDLSRFDRAEMGDLVPRPGAEAALRTITALGKLMSTIHSAALVLLVDQIEEVVDLGTSDKDPGVVFRSAINTLVDIADGLPNAVVVVACLEDLFVPARQLLPLPKLDRLENDPEPVRLLSKRSHDQQEAIVERRLHVLFEESGVEPDPSEPIAPFRPEHLLQVAGARTRDLLDWCRRQRERCVAAGGWVEPDETQPRPAVGPDLTALRQRWNDRLAEWELDPVTAEADAAALLAWALTNASAELPQGVLVAARTEDRFVWLDLEVPGRPREELLVAMCELTPKWGHLGRQIDEAVAHANGRPVVFVRSTDFPRDSRTQVAQRLAELCQPLGVHRRIVVQASEWRAMDAFRALHDHLRLDSAFADWQREDTPLGGLPAVRDLLALRRLERDLAGRSDPDGPWVGHGRGETGRLRLGQTRGVHPEAVWFDPPKLTRHAAFVGGPRSGIAGAAMVLVEGLLLRGVPALVVTRRGDLASYGDDDVWTRPEPDGDRAARRERLHELAHVQLYRPGAAAGPGLAVPIAPPDLHLLPEAERDQLAKYSAWALGTLMGYKPRNADPRVAILQKAIEVTAHGGRAVTVPAIHKVVRDRDRALLLAAGSLEDRHYTSLAEDLQKFGQQRRRLLESGDPLDLDRLAGRGDARTPLTIVDIHRLEDDATVDFWVTELLLALEAWRARNPSPRPQLAVVLDQVERYLPVAGRNPTAKGPLETLLKRARSAGIGFVLLSESPGDFDLQGRSDQIATWVVGKTTEKVAIFQLRGMLAAAHLDAEKPPDLQGGQFFVLVNGEGWTVDVDASLVSTA